MNKLTGLLGLPPATLNVLSTGIAIFLSCTGARIYKAPELALRIANTQLITSNSADRLDRLAHQLDEQAEIIKQKDQAYQQLKATYQGFLTNKAGGIELDKAFDVIEELPEVENTEDIQIEIELIEEDLSEITTE